MLVYTIICDWTWLWENRSYLHKIHLFILWQLYLLFSIHYPRSICFIEIFMYFCIHDDILHRIWITDKRLLHFRFTKSDQILCVDKIGFSRPGHIITILCSCTTAAFNSFINVLYRRNHALVATLLSIYILLTYIAY